MTKKSLTHAKHHFDKKKYRYNKKIVAGIRQSHPGISFGTLIAPSSRYARHHDVRPNFKLKRVGR